MPIRLVIFASLIAAALLQVARASAVVISPAHLTSLVDPGKEQLIAVKVTNDSNARQKFTASISGVKQDDQGRPRFGTSFDPVEQWITPPSSFFLNAGEKKSIIFTLKVPKDAEAGTHYAALLISEQPGVGQVALAGQATVLVGVNVSGVVQEALSVEVWRSDHLIVTGRHWPFKLVLKNNGTVSVPLEGTINITWLGNNIATQPVALGNQVLPQTFRDLTVVAEPKFTLPGPYQVSITARYGLSRTTTTATTTVWYVPPWFWITFVIFISITISLRARRRRQF